MDNLRVFSEKLDSLVEIGMSTVYCSSTHYSVSYEDWTNGGWCNDYGQWNNGGWNNDYGHWINGGWNNDYGQWTNGGWSNNGGK